MRRPRAESPFNRVALRRRQALFLQFAPSPFGDDGFSFVVSNRSCSTFGNSCLMRFRKRSTVLCTVLWSIFGLS
jgi:hypothetical protein